VEQGQKLHEWDPFSNPILSDVHGQVKFGDILEGVTMQEQIDEFSGQSLKVIVEPKDPDLRPRISIKDDDGSTLSRFLMPVGVNLVVTEGDRVQPGDRLARIARETTTARSTGRSPSAATCAASGE
jgi:DNA-directed RNA polymerase subunit beta'